MSLVLILVIVGGLMISFIYICSLIPNEPFIRNSLWLTPLIIFLIMIGLILPSRFKFNLTFTESFHPLTLIRRNTLISVLFIVLILILALLVVCTNTLQVKNPMRTFL